MFIKIMIILFKYLAIKTLSLVHVMKNEGPLGIGLFCFYFHLLFFQAILFSNLLYAQDFAQSFNTLLKVKLYG